MGHTCFWISWKPMTYQGVSDQDGGSSWGQREDLRRGRNVVVAWSRWKSKNNNQAARGSTVQGRGSEQGWNQARELSRHQEPQWAQKTSLGSCVQQTAAEKRHPGSWQHPLVGGGQHSGWFVVSWRLAVVWWPTAAPLPDCCLAGTVNSLAVT